MLMKIITKIFVVVFCLSFMSIAITMMHNDNPIFMIPFIILPLFVIIGVLFGKGDKEHKSNNVNHKDNDFITDGKKIQKKLEDLDYLYNRNLISKEEYEKTRENIISDK